MSGPSFSNKRFQKTPAGTQRPPTTQTEVPRIHASDYRRVGQERAKKEAELEMVYAVNITMSPVRWSTVDKTCKITDVSMLDSPNMGAHSFKGQCDIYQCEDCPGHAGCIEFKLPIYHPVYFSKILGILNVACSSCSRLLLNDEEQIKILRRIPKPSRLSYLSSLVKTSKGFGNVECPHFTSLPTDYTSLYKYFPLSQTSILDVYNNKQEMMNLSGYQLRVAFDSDKVGQLTFISSTTGFPVEIKAWGRKVNFFVFTEPYEGHLTRLEYKQKRVLYNYEKKRLYFYAELDQDVGVEFSPDIPFKVIQKTKQCDEPRAYLIKDSLALGMVKYRSGDNENILHIGDVINILSNISVSDMELLGFDKNDVIEGFIMRGMTVLPPICRPLTIKGGPHEYTKFLAEIVKANRELENAVLGNGRDVAESHRKLYMEVSKYIDKLSSDMGGKEGYIRKNILSKRANHSGRAVIGPAESSIAWGWVVLPQEMENALIQEDVTAQNYHAIKKMLKEGKIKLIIPLRGNPRHVMMDKINDYTIKVGDKVGRKVMNGDWCIIVRQPSIQEHSLTAHQVIFSPGRKTIGLSILDTTPKGGDFDGDEMSVHFPQSIEARLEAEMLGDIRKRLISSQNSTPITGLVLNSVVLSFILTAPGFRVTRQTFNKCLGVMRRTTQLDTLRERLATSGRKPIHPFSGKALFSALLPETFNYKNDSIVIVNGILISGRVTKKVVGPGKSRAIHHLLFHSYGWEIASDFLTDATRVMDVVNDEIGFSISFGDFSYAFKDKARKMIDEYYDTANEFLSKNPDASESDILSYVTKIDHIGYDVVKADNERRKKQIEKSHVMRFLKEERAENFYRGVEKLPYPREIKDKLYSIVSTFKDVKLSVTFRALGSGAIDAIVLATKEVFYQNPGSRENMTPEKVELYLDQLTGQIKVTPQEFNFEEMFMALEEKDYPKFKSNLYRALEHDMRNIFNPSMITGMSELNAMWVMSESGSKGSAGNTAESLGSRGFQFTDEGFIARSLPGQRILTSYKPETRCLESYGYCRGNFTTGLEPEEYASHTIASRIKQVQSTTLIPIIGTIRRNLTKSMEDTKFTGSLVLDTATGGTINEIIYGGDNFRPSELIGQNEDFIDFSSLSLRINAEAGWFPDVEIDENDVAEDFDLIY